MSLRVRRVGVGAEMDRMAPNGPTTRAAGEREGAREREAAQEHRNAERERAPESREQRLALAQIRPQGHDARTN